MEQLTRSELLALVSRSDLLASECQAMQEQGVNWQGRERATAGPTGGGSALDRQLIAQAMAKLERNARG